MLLRPLEEQLVLLLRPLVPLELQLVQRREMVHLMVLVRHLELLRHEPLALVHQLACQRLVRSQLKRGK